MPPDLVPLLDLFTSTTCRIENGGLDKDILQSALGLCIVHSMAALRQLSQRVSAEAKSKITFCFGKGSHVFQCCL